MSRIICFFIIAGLFCNRPAAAAIKPLATIRVKNTSKIQRQNEVVSVNFSQLASKVGGSAFKMLDQNKKEVIYQLEYKGMKEPQYLLLQIRDLKPGEETVFDLITGSPEKAQALTYARYVPERKDDFAWENDRVAFRMYGKALETASDNAFGTDFWAKRTDKLIIDKWYKSGDYHRDKGEGMDFYTVGLTLGAGDVAPYINDSIYFSANYHDYKVLDNGPLRSTFQLKYDSWKAGNLIVSATKTISLSAGSQLNRVEVNYAISGAPATEVVVGISKRKLPGSVLFDEANSIMAYWEPEIAGKGIIGVGVILPQKRVDMTIEKGHLLARLSIENNVPLVYYNGGVWNRAGILTTDNGWFKYLKDFRDSLNSPLEVQVQ